MITSFLFQLTLVKEDRLKITLELLFSDFERNNKVFMVDNGVVLIAYCGVDLFNHIANC